MTSRERPADRGRRRAIGAIRRLGEEHRRARVGAGLSLRAVGRATNTSHQQIARFERAEISNVSIEDAGAWCAVVGLDLVIRAYPGGDAIRDVGQQRLLGRLRARLGPAVKWRTEVPIGVDGDLRAWDAVVDGSGWTLHVEAETVLDDVQAVERRLSLKSFDGAAQRVLLLLADTPRNRRAMAVSQAAFGAYVQGNRRILRSLTDRTLSPPPRSLLFL
jgi:transcriptional regulator with XRE-family HTH domain